MAYSSRRPRLDLSRPVSNHPLNAGLVSWWLVLPHLYGGQRLWDLRNYAHGTLTNGPTWQPARRPGGYGALGFAQASSQRVSLPVAVALDPGSGPFTLAAWFQSNVAGSTNRTILRRDGLGITTPRTIILLRVNTSNRLQFYISDGTSEDNIEWSTSVHDGQWRLAVAVREATGGSVRLYADGVQVASASRTTGDLLTGVAWHLGADRGISEYYDGRLDGAQYYSRALSAGEVAALYRDSCLGHPETLRWLPDRTWSLPEQQGGAVAESPRLLSLLGVGC